MSEAQGNGAWLAADRDALRDKAAFGAPIGTEWRREERANRTATPLESTDAEGISGRDWMNRAKEAVDNTYREFSQPNAWKPSNRTLESFREDARYAVADAWRHPEAAKAMQAAGASERGMQDDLSAGRTAKVMDGLSASDPAVVERKQTAADVVKLPDAAQVRRERVRQAATDYRAGLMTAAPVRAEASALAETQTRRAVQRV